MNFKILFVLYKDLFIVIIKMSKVKAFIINIYRNVKQYITSFYKVPSNIENVYKELAEVRILIGKINDNINELKEIDFIAVGK